MQMDSSALKEQRQQSESEKREAELLRELERRGLIDEHRMVDISKANKAFLPRAEWKQKKINWTDFWKAYRAENWALKPEKYVKVLYGKPSYKEGAGVLGGEVAVPVYDSGFTLGTPSVKGGVGIREDKVGQQQWKVEAGMEQTSTEGGPYVEAGALGFFAHIGKAVKGIAVGIAEGIFSIGAQIVGGVKYFLSAALGPWTGKINVVTGAVSGVFSWLHMAFEMASNAVKRAFGDQNEIYSGQDFDRIKEGVIIVGTDARRKMVKTTVSKIIERKEKEVRFLDEKGKERIAEADASGMRVYDYAGFFRRLGRALNPANLVKDAYNAAVVKPILKLKDTYDGFRNPPTDKKLAVQEIEKYSRQGVLDRLALTRPKAGSAVEKAEDAMWQAYERKDYNTARYIARLLVNGTEGAKKGEYMLALDDIEWAGANQGFFIGYTPGLGFGNRRRMADASIEKRVKESKKAIEEAEPDSLEFMCARKYIAGKAEFRVTAAHKRSPRSYSPERLQKDIIGAYVKADERMSKHMVSPETGQVDFMGGIVITRSGPEWARKEKFMEFLQAAYEKMPDLRPDLKVLHNLFSSQNYWETQPTIDAYYRDFIAKTGGAILDHEIRGLSEKEIKTAYNRWRPQKKA